MIGLFATVSGARGPAEPVHCRTLGHPMELKAALEQLRDSVDPCGESPEIIALLERIERCNSRVSICLDRSSSSNYFDRPGSSPTGLRTITWNPDLKSQIDTGCGGDPDRPIHRDPIASLLHELAHAAQDCDGLDPGHHELEAVRIENIYRRAAGLCQRVRYGED